MREIDLQTWARRNVYGLFSDCDWPFYQVSFPLDVTNLRAYTKKEGLSFYFTLSWLLTKGMEQQEAFLIRIREGRLFVLDELMPSCTVLRPGEEVFRIISLPAGENPADFCRRAGALAQTQAALYDPDDCIPRVGWGKYQMQNGRLILPICLEVNHKTVDGLHIGRLYEYLQNTIDNL